LLCIMVASINYMLVLVTLCSIFVANFVMVDIFFRGGLLCILVTSINYMLVGVTMCSIFLANFMVGEVFFF
jgi:hypothetical protein